MRSNGPRSVCVHRAVGLPVRDWGREEVTLWYGQSEINNNDLILCVDWAVLVFVPVCVCLTVLCVRNIHVYRPCADLVHLW